MNPDMIFLIGAQLAVAVTYHAWIILAFHFSLLIHHSSVLVLLRLHSHICLVPVLGHYILLKLVIKLNKFVLYFKVDIDDVAIPPNVHKSCSFFVIICNSIQKKWLDEKKHPKIKMNQTNRIAEKRGRRKTPWPYSNENNSPRELKQAILVFMLNRKRSTVFNLFILYWRKKEIYVITVNQKRDLYNFEMADLGRRDEATNIKMLYVRIRW